MKRLLFLALIAIPACTPQSGAITGDVLTGLCDVGFVALGAPGAMPICADINLIEQMISNRNKTTATQGAGVVAPMSQTDLYMMVKASGNYRPARVK